MLRRPPGSTRTDTLFPTRTPFRSGLLCVQGFVVGCSEAGTLISDAKGLTKVTEAASVEGRKEGVWQPPAGHQQTPLWPRAAPNMEDVKLPPEYSETATNPKRFAGRPVTGVFNVTVPTLTEIGRAHV